VTVRRARDHPAVGSNLDRLALGPDPFRDGPVYTYDAPSLPEGWLVERIAPRVWDEKPLPFAPFKLPTSAYTGRTAKGRARRS
jgi:hypothetical protein